MQRSFDRTTAGTRVAAAAEIFSDVRHVQLAFAPQAHSKSSIRKLTEEDGNFHVADRERIIHQAFAILFFRAGALHLLLRDPYPGERAFALQGRKSRTQQPQLRGGMSEINVP